MRELDRLDREHGLGTMPGAAPVRTRGRAGGSPALAGIVIVALLLTGVTLVQPGSQFLTVLRQLGVAPDRYGDPPDFTPGSGSYAFASTRRGGDPVGYDPCERVEYVVNTAGAPENWKELVETAVAHTEWATGLAFAFEGESETRPFDPLQTHGLVGRDQPVVLGFADADEFTDLSGDVAGLGGSVAFDDGIGGKYFETGSIVLDTDVFGDPRYAQEDLQAIVDHEFGHLVGLDHVDSTAELMHPSGSTRRTYGDGDLEGLARLGSIPCR